MYGLINSSLQSMIRETFGDEVPIHLEFVRFDGEVTCFGLQLVRYTTDERLLEIIEFHNGHIAVVSTPGEGSTFTVTLPIGSLDLLDGLNIP